MGNIILLRGLAREALHWNDFPQLLAQSLQVEQKSVLCPDFSGCGKFHKETAATTIAAMTEHVREQVKNHPGADRQRHLIIGLSMGGMVVLDWLERFPGEIAGAVIINSSLASQPLWWRVRPAVWGRIIASLVAAPEQREKIMLRAVSNDASHYAIHERQWLDIQKTHGVTLRTVVAMLQAARTFRCELHVSKIPGLVLGSQHDRLVSIKCSREIAHRVQWPLQVHPWAGHDLPMDDAQWVCKEIAQWWRDVFVKEKYSQENNLSRIIRFPGKAGGSPATKR